MPEAFVSNLVFIHFKTSTFANVTINPYYLVDFVNATLVPDDLLVWGSLRLAPINVKSVG